MAVRHYAWQWVPAEHAGDVSKALGALAAMGLLWLLAGYRNPGDDLARWAMLLYAWHEASVVLCVGWFIAAPWPILPGQAMCSSRVGFDLSALGLLLLAMLASRGMRKHKS